MELFFSVFYKSIPLTIPYNLSFGPIDTFDTFYLVARAQDNRSLVGISEITPLPGYSHETFDSVKIILLQIVDKIQMGQSLVDVLASYVHTAPFAVSGVITAFELVKKHNKLVSQALEEPVELAALCDASTPLLIKKRAEELMREGFRTLKMKVGKYEISDELERIRAVSSILPNDAIVRLDANQAYGFEQAMKLCEGLEDIEHIELLEQPFKPDFWSETEALANKTSVPIMLDESIWGHNDLKKAANSGVKYVKFKLCKHLGIEGSLNLIKDARSHGLGIVYGNGVQSALGNHYEALIHSQTNIETASESNGFLKIQAKMFSDFLKMDRGFLFDNGFDCNEYFTKYWQCIIPEVPLLIDKIETLVTDIQHYEVLNG
nr:enolase C-terminal domain-like protein [uncultured Desulfobacter sp.]